MIDFLDVLTYVDLFKEVSREELENVITSDLYNIRNYSKEAVVYFQNEKCTSLDVILNGVVSVQGIDEEGNYISITDFTTGNILGGNLIFCSKNAYPMTVIAKTDVSIMHLKKELVLKLCQSNTSFLSSFLESISDNTLILANRIKTLSLKSLRESIVDFLIYESYVQKSNKIKLELSKKALAEKFGVQRTSLSRELNKMRKEGLIDFDAYSITIVDLHI